MRMRVATAVCRSKFAFVNRNPVGHERAQRIARHAAQPLYALHRQGRAGLRAAIAEELHRGLASPHAAR